MHTFIRKFRKNHIFYILYCYTANYKGARICSGTACSIYIYIYLMLFLSKFGTFVAAVHPIRFNSDNNIKYF
ncbi:hypothetical protein GCM10010495_82290 [Kitasatospora herbaricolor]|nr:hypothetical protein GCM10010495_82290 [Kitasatospora herbaricolor]